LPATLYLIATPIGNLEDITLRALRVLREEVAVIACEDTRQTQKLLDHFEIRKPLWSYHEHNEAARSEQIINALENGESVALVSDAGTPLISDPGYRVVAAAVQKQILVVPLPGASAAITALAASGLAADEFRFVGFLPAKSGARRKTIEQLADETGTVIAYESPHRILECLSEVAEILGERPVVVARELTKIHEEFLRGTASSILAELQSRPSVRGEITLLIGRSEAKDDIDDPQGEVLRMEREGGLNRMDAIKLVAKRMGLPKREVYRLFSEPGSNPPDKRRG